MTPTSVGPQSIYVYAVVYLYLAVRVCAPIIRLTRIPLQRQYKLYTSYAQSQSILSTKQGNCHRPKTGASNRRLKPEVPKFQRKAKFSEYGQRGTESLEDRCKLPHTALRCRIHLQVHKQRALIETPSVYLISSPVITPGDARKERDCKKDCVRKMKAEYALSGAPERFWV